MYLQRQNVTFIELDMWAPNSLDLNPVDYAFWGPYHLYHGRKVDTVAQLKQAIVLEWRALSQRFIDGSINQ